MEESCQHLDRGTGHTLVPLSPAMITTKTFDSIPLTESGGKDYIVSFGYQISQHQQEPDEAKRARESWKLSFSERQ